MRQNSKSLEILSKNKEFIYGGSVSTNRTVEPELVFVKGQGAYMWDADGYRYTDYHAAFAPHMLGHNDPYVTDAVARTLNSGASLFGAGTTELEGRLAELICHAVPFLNSVQLLNTGSEATYQALRLARAVTGRNHIVVMQGGYNGWHNDVACNLMTPLSALGERPTPGEYPFVPISAGIPPEHSSLIHPINFNDLASVEYVCEQYPVAALITEPILQNVGLVKPKPGYLEGLRKLADRFGFILIFDEVKTGFRHALGGYASIAGVVPDLAVYGKALANGYPIAAIAGKHDLMRYFVHPDADKRVLLAGTYNAHPVPTAAAVATIERLMENDGEVYKKLDSLGARFESALKKTVAAQGIDATVVRQGSAFCLYFMDHAPVDWIDLASHHDFETDRAMRRQVIDLGTYVFPLPIKQCSISSAHTEADVDESAMHVESVLANVMVH
jgi:glutamate-1-semialdehyde 2,1-aminomutase